LVGAADNHSNKSVLAEVVFVQQKSISLITDFFANLIFLLNKIFIGVKLWKPSSCRQNTKAVLIVTTSLWVGHNSKSICIALIANGRL
jgi:hypothetical protein